MDASTTSSAASTTSAASSMGGGVWENGPSALSSRSIVNTMNAPPTAAQRLVASDRIRGLECLVLYLDHAAHYFGHILKSEIIQNSAEKLVPTVRDLDEELRKHLELVKKTLAETEAIANAPVVSEDDRPKYRVSPVVITKTLQRMDVYVRNETNTGYTRHYYTFSAKQTRKMTAGGYKLSDRILYAVQCPDGTTHEIASRFPADVVERMLNKESRPNDPHSVQYEIAFVSKPDRKFVAPRIVALRTYRDPYGYAGRLADPSTYQAFEKRGRNDTEIPDALTTVVLAETWANWGGIERCIDDGIQRSHRYDAGDNRVNIGLPNPNRSLPLTGFRAKGEELLKGRDDAVRNLRETRIELNQSICAEAMKPSRVEKMIEKYGMDWLETA